jgi:hypothetical protein
MAIERGLPTVHAPTSTVYSERRLRRPAYGIKAPPRTRKTLRERRPRRSSRKGRTLDVDRARGGGVLRRELWAWIAAALASGCAHSSDTTATGTLGEQSYRRGFIIGEAEQFFGNGAQGLADVLNRILREHGTPNAYIKGEEGAAAAGIGLRYGRGTLYMHDGTSAEVYWRGPSFGIDLGGNAAKAFVLVYDLPSIDALFQRFGGVEGSLYYVGGVSVTYNRNDATVLAPVRFGVGWRQGVSVGYLHLSAERSWIPF